MLMVLVTVVTVTAATVAMPLTRILKGLPLSKEAELKYGGSVKTLAFLPKLWLETAGFWLNSKGDPDPTSFPALPEGTVTLATFVVPAVSVPTANKVSVIAVKFRT